MDQINPNPGNGDYNPFGFSFNSGENSRLLFYVGLWGNNTDEWIQVDDFVLNCYTQY
jgi:hypothetical protein